ncbi:MAG: type II toxin-antitoxin system RelE/ParE family toxin [Bryobacteraceae bacterium]|jgi:phage-related protein
MHRPTAYAGSLFTVVYAVCADRSSPGAQFYRTELDDLERAKMNTLFKYIGDHGRITNQEKFRKLQGELWEFKSHQVRMPCYYLPGRLLVITHGFRKKGNSTPPEEIARAGRIRQEDGAVFREGRPIKWRN